MYKRQGLADLAIGGRDHGLGVGIGLAGIGAHRRSGVHAVLRCLLYTSDAADDNVRV
ncbi:hypothetical protein [Dyella sp. ASV21]|uniref:hypothetical protein n=1 Tax=Dyella sp. ASV21 TaxID=2795114 RepID=UPI0018EE0F07|nr:hypothetical protein [Dyella sp. ASV21]